MAPKLGNKSSVFWAAIVGNILEYYDFTVYIVFSIEIGRTFFPNDLGISQVLGSLLAFAFGFLARPLGGIVLGHLGDKFGRKTALVCSALGMTCATFAIGILPGYEVIGPLAILALFVFRLIQGFCISGEGTGAAIFILEHYKVKRSGLMAGIVHSTNIGGTLLATFVSLALRHMLPEVTFIWRFAFLFGGLLGIFALFLRWKVSETPIFAMMQKQKGAAKEGMMCIIRSSWRKMFLTFVISSFASSMVQMIKGYVNVYYQDVKGLSAQTSLVYLMYTSVVLMISMVSFGGLGDRFGKARILVLSGFMAMLLSLPALWLMSGPTVFHHILALTLLDIIAGAASASAYAFVISIFAPAQRFFGVSVSYNLGIALFGGTSPVIARFLVNIFGKEYAPSYYIIVLSILFLITMFQMRGLLVQKECI